MPAISKIRFTNVVYEGGAKRYNNSVFYFDGHNGAIVLENGGGKTVFIQTAIQAVLPHVEVAGRKMKDTLSLENGPAHIAIEWLLAEKPRRRYAVTCVSLFMSSTGLDSLRYLYEYSENDDHGLGKLPFTKDSGGGKERVTEKGEIQEYYQSMSQRYPLLAKTFDTIKGFHEYIERQFHIIPSEWEAIVKINSNEGGIEAFFDECKTTSQLVDRLLIPTIEASMEGFKQGTFADLFQVQREGFKQYKELREKIEENRRILAELNKYVVGYERLHGRQLDYGDLQKEAKTYLRFATKREQEQESEQGRLQGRMTEWQLRNTLWRKKEASLRIAGERQSEGALETALYEIENEKEKLEDQVSAAKRHYYSLQFAEHREKLREAEAKLVYVNEQIGRLAQSYDERELQRLWEGNGSKLRALFLQEEQRLSELQRSIGTAASELATQKQEAVAGKGAEAKEREQLLVKIAGIEVQQQEKQEQKEDIARRILSNSQSQSVEDELPLWLEEQRQLEEQSLEQQRKLQEVERKKGELQRQGKEAADEQLSVKAELAALQGQKERYELEHQQVRTQLSLLRPSWERLGSVHEKMSSLVEQVAEEIERRLQQKQQLLYKERLAFRYVDDYEQQHLFFADPQAARLVEQWSNQFSMLEVGVQYAVNTAQADANELWAVTLVTTVQEKPFLQRKLADAADQLQYPIRVLSTQEARELAGRGERETQQRLAETGGQWVEPAHWQPLQDAGRFAEWKRSVGLVAEEAAQKRKEKESELERWRDAQKLLLSFFAAYPLASVQELERKLAELLDRQLRLAERISYMNKELQQMDRHKDELQDALRLNVQQQQRVESRLEQGYRYVRLAEQLTMLAQELQPVRESMLRADRAVISWDRRLEELDRELGQRSIELNDVLGKLQRLQEDDVYAEVSGCEPLAADEPISRLREERKDLDRQRHRIMKERSELELDRSHQQEKQVASTREMNRLRDEHSDLLTELELPVHVESRLKEVLTDVRALEQRLDKVSKEWSAKERALLKQQTEIGTLVRQYAEAFAMEEPLVFQEALSRVQEEQAQERRTLEEEHKELDRLLLAAERGLQEVRVVLQLWNSYVRVHKLDDPHLDVVELSFESVSELSYQLEARSRDAIERLDRQLGSISEERKRVAANRQRFKDFCGKQVQDVKLREMAERGVDVKESYTELREFEAMMETSILKANHIAELRMQTEDQKLQQYIAHIQAHLKQITQELRDLPKKTRVRTETGNKEIYVFHIPEWDEQEGKERIRTHIEWIISQLDSAKYTGEQGEEQVSIVRRDLDKWLDAKQLLQKVFQQGAIRISCRKVTNDQQVTGATYSWEESNRWSGGEKWSKNMTLFLGILNYVAEKRQHIHSQMKRHRTVIMDNPFGKASSDHVLSPVFYIAEQLGFQIIALTAHVEGKFLQDYFPVVYSCRLRSVAGGSGKQIVDPTQKIQQAYFRDHAPESLDRIGELKQMELF